MGQKGLISDSKFYSRDKVGYSTHATYHFGYQHKMVLRKTVPAVPFDNFGHVPVISRNKNITLQGNKIIQSCHLG